VSGIFVNSLVERRINSVLYQNSHETHYTTTRTPCTSLATDYTGWAKKVNLLIVATTFIYSQPIFVIFGA